MDDKYKKVLEKYASDPNKLAEAYASLEEKLGTQGTELGTLRKQSEEAAQRLQQYDAYVKQAQPVVSWYAQNQEKVRQLWEQAAKPAQQTQTAPATSILTPEEQQALYQQFAAQTQQQILQPWSQQFARTAEQYLNQRLQNFDQEVDKRVKANTQVMWKTIERAFPKEQIDSVKAYHEEAIKWADPAKIDPFEAANANLEARSRIADLESKVKTYEDEKAAREKANTPSLGNSTSLFPRDSENKPVTPSNRDDRFSAVMNTLHQTHGNAGYDALFTKK